MNTTRIRLAFAPDERPANIHDDFHWARTHEQELLQQYGECVAIIYQHQVIGTGQTYDEAVENAEHHLSDESPAITPVMYFLHHRHPFYRVRPR